MFSELKDKFLLSAKLFNMANLFFEKEFLYFNA